MSELAERLDDAYERLRGQHVPGGGDYLTVDQVAKLGKCHPKTIRRAIGRGELRAFRFGGRLLIREEDARARIEAEEASPNPAPSGIASLPAANPASSARRVARMREADPDL